jgi:hypothetical protein
MYVVGMWHRTVILSQKFAVAGVLKKENLPWPHVKDM